MLQFTVSGNNPYECPVMIIVLLLVAVHFEQCNLTSVSSASYLLSDYEDNALTKPIGALGSGFEFCPPPLPFLHYE